MGLQSAQCGGDGGGGDEARVRRCLLPSWPLPAPCGSSKVGATQSTVQHSVQCAMCSCSEGELAEITPPDLLRAYLRKQIGQDIEDSS